MQHEIVEDQLYLVGTEAEFDDIGEGLTMLASEVEQLDAMGLRGTMPPATDIEALRSRMPSSADRVHSEVPQRVAITADELIVLCSGARVAFTSAQHMSVTMRRIRPEISASASLKATRYRALRTHLDHIRQVNGITTADSE